MTATYARKCGMCGQVHLCGRRLGECRCTWCHRDLEIETIGVTPDTEAPDWLAELWREARNG